MGAMRVVDIVTEDFSAEAIYYGDMPLKDMMEVSTSVDAVQRVRRWAELMEKAILDPEKVGEFMALSFDESMQVCSLYLKLKPREMFVEID